MDGVISYFLGGVFYCFVEFLVENVDYFCQWLLEKFEYKGFIVMLFLGEGFYVILGLGVNQVRIVYVFNIIDFYVVMDCLEEVLKVYFGRIKVG